MNRRKHRRQAAPFLTIIVFALALPVLANFLYHNGELIGAAGERAAMMAAALNMPDGGLALLEERFRSQLYTEPPAAETAQPGPPPASSALPAEEPAAAPAVEQDMQPLQPSSSPWPVPPKIPAEYAAPLLSENFSGNEGLTLYKFNAGFLRNDTRYGEEELLALLEGNFPLAFADTAEPQVLILHTHATESFELYDSDTYDTRNTWRSRDNNLNMAAVGAVMADVLEQNGIGVVHDTTQHDYPSYNGSYERSAETVKKYLREYPTIKVVLDLHRDAMEREDGSIVKPVAMIGGQKAAQIMIIAGCDDGGMNMPDWPENLRFAAEFQSYMESSYPGLTRPVYVCHRKYNMDLSAGALLLEFGSNANTLSEVLYSASMAGQALADLIRDYTDWTGYP